MELDSVCRGLFYLSIFFSFIFSFDRRQAAPGGRSMELDPVCRGLFYLSIFFSFISISTVDRMSMPSRHSRRRQAPALHIRRR